jgi:hypothetical protein
VHRRTLSIDGECACEVNTSDVRVNNLGGIGKLRNEKL